MRRMKITAALLIILAGTVTGCSAPIFAGLTVGEFSLAASLVSTAATGKGLGEHAMDAATGRDCRVLEGLAREDRKVCERQDSPVLEDDWQGLAGLADEAGPSAHAGVWDTAPRDGRDG